MTKVLNFKKVIVSVIFFFMLFSILGLNVGNSEALYTEVERIHGPNRHTTAVEISKKGWSSADVVFLARDDGYADALAGVPLAYAYDSPILLTASGQLNSSTLSEIISLGASKVVILGGEVAVSKGVEEALYTHMPSGFEVERIAGEDRYDTARKIAMALAEKNEVSSFDTAVLVYGGNFPDALSVASHAAVNGYPILLTQRDVLPESTQEAINSFNIGEFKAIGGETVIGKELVDSLGAKRIWGSDRYTTSLEVLKEFNPAGSIVYLATGLDFADAVAGGVLAAKNNASILLVNGKTVDYEIRSYLENNEINVKVLGGYNAVREGILSTEYLEELALQFVPRVILHPSYEFWAEYNLNDKIFLGPSWEPYPIKGMPTWDENPYNLNTWRFYLHSLEHVAYLAAGYELTGDERYLAKGMEHILSWIEVNGNEAEAKNVYAWHDHGTANRVQNVMHLWFHWKDSSLYDESIDEVLLVNLHKHAVFLANPSNYSPYNHGVFQDQALLQIAAVFDGFTESEKWKELALTRLLIRLKEDVTSEGVHKEHSPNYHLLIMNRFTGITALSNYYDIKLSSEIATYMHKMESYLARVTKPNGFLPHVGDTRDMKTFNRYRDQAVSPLLSYVQSAGVIGNAPEEKDMVYPEAGVALFRDGWNFEDDDLYIMFTSAFHSRFHKHGDDLAFILSRGETDFLVDGGMYNYVENDPMRKYLRGALGHNTIVVDDKAYTISDEQAGKAMITEYGVYEDFSYVIGEHTLYNGILIERTLIHHKPSTIIIHDKIIGDKNRNYSQIFHLGQDVKVELAQTDKLIVSSKTSNQTMTLRQVNPVEAMSHYNGQINPHRGWHSTSLSEAKPIDTFHFKNSGKDSEFLTLLTFEDSQFVDIQVDGENYILISENGDKEVLDLKR